MVIKLPQSMKVYSDRDLLYSILLAITEGGLGGGVSIESGNGVPDNGDGDDGAWYLDADSRILYQKEAGVWVEKGVMAKDVSDSEVTFETPTAGEGKAPLTTP